MSITLIGSKIFCYIDLLANINALLLQQSLKCGYKMCNEAFYNSTINIETSLGC